MHFIKIFESKLCLVAATWLALSAMRWMDKVIHKPIRVVYYHDVFHKLLVGYYLEIIAKYLCLEALGQENSDFVSNTDCKISE